MMTPVDQRLAGCPATGNLPEAASQTARLRQRAHQAQTCLVPARAALREQANAVALAILPALDAASETQLPARRQNPLVDHVEREALRLLRLDPAYTDIEGEDRHHHRCERDLDGLIQLQHHRAPCQPGRRTQIGGAPGIGGAGTRQRLQIHRQLQRHTGEPAFLVDAAVERQEIQHLVAAVAAQIFPHAGLDLHLMTGRASRLHPLGRVHLRCLGGRIQRAAAGPHRCSVAAFGAQQHRSQQLGADARSAQVPIARCAA